MRNGHKKRHSQICMKPLTLCQANIHRVRGWITRAIQLNLLAYLLSVKPTEINQWKGYQRKHSWAPCRITHFLSRKRTKVEEMGIRRNTAKLGMLE